MAVKAAHQARQEARPRRATSSRSRRWSPHVMETGQRKRRRRQHRSRARSSTSSPARSTGKRGLLAADFEPAISANPYIQFKFEAQESGPVVLTWTDDDGTTIVGEETHHGEQPVERSRPGSGARSGEVAARSPGGETSLASGRRLRMISRRDSPGAAATAASCRGWTRAFAQQRLTQDELLRFDAARQRHARCMSPTCTRSSRRCYFREPSINLGVGEATGQLPHLTGQALLDLLQHRAGARRGLCADLGGFRGAGQDLRPARRARSHRDRRQGDPRRARATACCCSTAATPGRAATPR